MNNTPFTDCCRPIARDELGWVTPSALVVLHVCLMPALIRSHSLTLLCVNRCVGCVYGYMGVLLLLLLLLFVLMCFVIIRDHAFCACAYSTHTHTHIF